MKRTTPKSADWELYRHVERKCSEMVKSRNAVVNIAGSALGIHQSLRVDARVLAGRADPPSHDVSCVRYIPSTWYPEFSELALWHSELMLRWRVSNNPARSILPTTNALYESIEQTLGRDQWNGRPPAVALAVAAVLVNADEDELEGFYDEKRFDDRETHPIFGRTKSLAFYTKDLQPLVSQVAELVEMQYVAPVRSSSPSLGTSL